MSTGLRALFVSQPARAYGEINVVVPLAESVMAKGGEVWFLVSPLAARVARARYPDRTFELTSNRELNQNTFWRMVRKFRPDVILFSAFHEILRPRRKLECPLVNWRWLQDIEEYSGELIFVDFIAHVPGLQEALECPDCAPRFGEPALRSFLNRLRVILPCPLNEPAEIAGRRGIPYRTELLPLTIDPAERAAIREPFVRNDGILILRGGANWQSMVAEELGFNLYNYLGHLLEIYLGDFPRQVCLISVSDRHKLLCSGRGNLKIANIRNLPPRDYEKLLLAADVILTDNEIGYTLARSIGHAPGVVMVNSYDFEQVLAREPLNSSLRRLVLEMERTAPGSIFPYRVYPLVAEAEELCPSNDTRSQYLSCDNLSPQNLRLGRMPSSPFFRAELFGGEATRQFFECLLLDAQSRKELRQEERAYLGRLYEIDDGAAVINKVVEGSRAQAHTVI